MKGVVGIVAVSVSLAAIVVPQAQAPHSHQHPAPALAQAAPAQGWAIAGLGVGAQALKDNPADLAAIPPMRQALQHYARQFNDPAWQQAEPEQAR